MTRHNAFLELWERARRGDQDAQADLYRQYSPHLRRVIQYKLRDLRIAWAAEPHDVLDSFFVRLCGAAGQIHIEDALHFTHYCEKALRHKCRQILRSVMLRSTIRIEDCPPEVFQDPRAETDLNGMAWGEELKAAYSRLTPREREICRLNLKGYGWSEIGRQLNISADAARKAHQRAESRVRIECFAQSGAGLRCRSRR